MHVPIISGHLINKMYFRGNETFFLVVMFYVVGGRHIRLYIPHMEPKVKGEVRARYLKNESEHIPFGNILRKT